MNLKIKNKSGKEKQINNWVIEKFLVINLIQILNSNINSTIRYKQSILNLFFNNNSIRNVIAFFTQLLILRFSFHYYLPLSNY